MKGCISFSLYGQGAKYSFGMLENVRLAGIHYPGWEVRVYAERGHYAVPKLTAAGARVIEMDHRPGSGGMFWRFLAGDDAEFSHVIIRDADSRINPRDAACTAEWIRSGKPLHVIRDNDWHELKPIMGGAWGVMPGRFDFAGEIGQWKHNFRYGDDEDFLGSKVWPQFYRSGDFLRHSHRPNSPDDTPIPAHEPYEGFVCEPITAVWNEPHDVVLLSPEKYHGRRARFLEEFAQKAPFLNPPRWHRGTTAQDRLLPRHFEHIEKYPHYYLASADHMDILEAAALGGSELLFVFEDDAVIGPDFSEFLLRAWVALPPDWLGMMLGGQPGTDRHRFHTDPPAPEALAIVRGCTGMHGTLWNRAGMVRAWNHFHYWNRLTIDQAFSRLQAEEPRFYAPAKWIVDVDPAAAQFGRDER